MHAATCLGNKERPTGKPRTGRVSLEQPMLAIRPRTVIFRPFRKTGVYSQRRLNSRVQYMHTQTNVGTVGVGGTDELQLYGKFQKITAQLRPQVSALLEDARSDLPAASVVVVEGTSCPRFGLWSHSGSIETLHRRSTPTAAPTLARTPTAGTSCLSHSRYG